MKRETTREGFAYAEKSVDVAPIRYHYMDNLRALAMLAGIFFHAALAWTPLLSQLWLTADTEQSMIMGSLAWFSHLFRMPVFFLIAGFFACYLVGKRGIGGFLKNRALRILLPFILFLPLVWASLGATIGWAMENVDNPSPMLGLFIYMSQVPDAPPPPVTTSHLWFLYVLFQFGLIYAVLERTGAMTMRWTRVVKSVPFLAFALPLLLVPSLLSVTAPTPAPEQFIPSAWYFGFFGVFFLLGAVIYRNQEVLAKIRPWAPWLAIISIILYAVFYSTLPKDVTLEQAMATQAGPRFSWSHLGIAIMEAYISVHMTLVCLALGQTLLNRANSVMRLVADSSYWVYIIHLPVLFLIQFYLLDSEWNMWIQFLVSSFGTLAIGFVSYLVLVRWTPIGWLLNGRKRKSPSKPGPLGGEKVDPAPEQATA